MLRVKPLVTVTAGFLRFEGSLDFDAVCLRCGQFHHRRDFSGATSGYKKLLLCLVWGPRPMRLGSPTTSATFTGFDD